MTAEEIDSRGKFYKEGYVDFAIIGFEEKLSKKMEPMLVVDLQLWDEAGKTGTIKDYITESMNWKTRDLLESIGYLEDADIEDLDFDKYRGCEGRGKIKYKKNDEGKWNHQFSYVMPELKNDEPNDSLDPLDDIKF
jgi:hypothetical protein